MKWYRKEHRDMFLKDLRSSLKLIKEDRHVLKYTPLAFKFARKVNCEEQKVGALNIQDIEQIAMCALKEAWNAVDWDKIEDKENAEKSLINYLSSNINGRIKKYVLEQATGVKIPQWYVTKSNKEEMVDALFGNWMFSFRLDNITEKALAKSTYADIIDWRPDSSKWENDELNDKLTTIMQPLRQLERDILMCHFGVGHKMSIKEIAEVCDMSVRGVEDAKRRALKKLNTEENREYLKEFL